jgi:SAM-dependent methyltransferase
MQKKPDYGMDAPGVIAIQLIIGLLGVGLALALLLAGVPHLFDMPFFEIALIVGLDCLLTAALMIWYSKAGKLHMRDRLLDLVPWRGDESVLDVGCGRGLMLVGAARRLTTGKAVGIDIWSRRDLSGNSPEATLENVRREGVAERVEVKDGDARQLSFTDASFDVVVSCLALHNIAKKEDRQQALREIARVLKPGGRLVLVDIQHTSEYARALTDSGLRDVVRTRAGLPFSWPMTVLSWGAVHFARVTAGKPTPAPV